MTNPSSPYNSTVYYGSFGTNEGVNPSDSYYSRREGFSPSGEDLDLYEVDLDLSPGPVPPSPKECINNSDNFVRSSESNKHFYSDWGNKVRNLKKNITKRDIICALLIAALLATIMTAVLYESHSSSN